MTTNIMTFNIQHGLDYINRCIDLKLMADTIKSLNADIVGLNEVRNAGPDPEYTDQAKTIADYLGWENCYFAEALKFDGVNPYGNAIVSKYKIESAETIMIPDPPVKDEDTYYETRCILKAKIAVGSGLTVLITHMGLARSEKKNAVSAILAEAAKVSGPLVIMGDFNMEPFHPTIKPLLEAYNDSADFFGNNKKSCPSDNPTMKIDYILYNNGLELAAADVPNIIASDHLPHTAAFSLR